MSILKVAKLGNPILLKKATEVEDFSSDSLKKTIYDMSETMLDYGGIGLAAPQVHISKRIIIIRNPEVDEDSNVEITPVINPKFTPLSDETEDNWEGCLSIPGMQGLVKRFKSIKYDGYDLEGKKIQNEVSGLYARVIQHEIDHLEGILYTARLAHKDAFGFEKEILDFWKKNIVSKVNE